jgi:hypothetical protein
MSVSLGSSPGNLDGLVSSMFEYLSRETWNASRHAAMVEVTMHDMIGSSRKRRQMERDRKKKASCAFMYWTHCNKRDKPSREPLLLCLCRMTRLPLSLLVHTLSSSLPSC